MTYKTHLSTGLLFTAVIFLLILKIKLIPILLVTLALSTILGASTPDLDAPTSKIWRKIPAGGLLGRIIHPVFIGGHRHLSHSLLGLGIFACLFGLLIRFISQFSFLNIQDFASVSSTGKIILIAYSIGYFSHLVADMFTESGVPLFFPLGYHFGIPPAPFEKIRIKTGRWFENLVVYPIVNIALILIIYRYIVK